MFVGVVASHSTSPILLTGGVTKLTKNPVAQPYGGRGNVYKIITTNYSIGSAENWAFLQLYFSFQCPLMMPLSLLLALHCRLISLGLT